MTRLAAGYPFHVAVLDRFQLRPDQSIETMGVALCEAGVRLHYNPDFVLSIRIAELGGVLLHEVHHVVFGHLSLSRDDYPDQVALTLAEEMTVNEYIVEPLPGTPI